MNSYYIEELKNEMTYIDLRILMYVDCELKYKKITEILNYLNNNAFITNLTTFYCEDMRAENYFEREDVMSLTIDMRDEKLRFKFYNGATTQWLYHTKDLFNALDAGRNEFSQIYDKYEPVTEVLFDFANRWKTSIYRITYKYFPEDDNDVDLVYNIIFTQEVKENKYENILLEKMNKEISMLGQDVTKDLNFKIIHSFRTGGCAPCEKARKEREKNETQSNGQGQIIG